MSIKETQAPKPVTPPPPPPSPPVTPALTEPAASAQVAGPGARSGSAMAYKGPSSVSSMALDAKAPLRYGSKDADYLKPATDNPGAVRALQHDLGQMNYFHSKWGETGGYFKDTRAAVKSFQEAHGLPATGEADDATRSAIASAKAAGHQKAVSPTDGPENTPASTAAAPAGSTGDGKPVTDATAAQPAGGSSNDALDKLRRMSAAELRQLGKTNPKAFLEALKPAAQEAERKYGVPASVTLAQAALESGYGKHTPGGDSFNFFGIKGKGTAGGVAAASNETPGGNRRTSTFAKYHNAADAIMEHGRLFHNGNYNSALASAQAGHGPEQFLRHIEGVYHRSGNKYTRDAMSIIKRHDLG